ncbi:hypothetical protein J6590_073698 [Homalodisca vitripennis]|nr:hypothetical protein J6590_073698 [Homalodisca vitripennis]
MQSPIISNVGTDTEELFYKVITRRNVYRLMFSSSIIFTDNLRSDRTSSRTLVKLTSVREVDGRPLRPSSSKFVLPY